MQPSDQRARRSTSEGSSGSQTRVPLRTGEEKPASQCYSDDGVLKLKPQAALRKLFGKSWGRVSGCTGRRCKGTSATEKTERIGCGHPLLSFFVQNEAASPGLVR